jgi:glycosyltransferase involved in cell wall biosynthesis
LSNKKVCYISDLAHHYREPIFKLMSETICCHFYFGNKTSSIKELDTSSLLGFQCRLPYVKIFGGFYYLWGSLWKALSYDKIILLGDPHGIQNWLICLVCRCAGKEVYLWTHGWYGKETLLRGFLKKALFRMSTKILVYGPRAKRMLLSEGFSDKEIEVVFNSLNYEEQTSIRERHSGVDLVSEYFGNENPVVIYVGRIQKVKRLDLLICALSKLKKEGIVVNFVIVGGFDDDNEISNLVIDKGVADQVWFHGPCYDETQLSNMFKNSDVCVSPGNVGLTAIHALTYGCPVITHDRFEMQMPEFESVIPGNTGDFYKYGDLESLAEKIKLWVDIDKSEREFVRRKCIEEVARRWNPQVQMQKICKALELEYAELDESEP